MRTPHLPDHDDTWTPDDARRVLDEWRRAGTTLAEFARRHGLSAARLYWWRRRLDRASSTALALVPAVVTTVPTRLARSTPTAPPAPTARARHVTVRFGSITVEVAAAAPRWVAALVTELARARS